VSTDTQKRQTVPKKDSREDEEYGLSSPSKSPKRKMFDLSLIRNIPQCTVGDLFSFKSRLFLKVAFKPIICNVDFQLFEKKQRRKLFGLRSAGSFAAGMGH
jgi:hypothetical protein